MNLFSGITRPILVTSHIRFGTDPDAFRKACKYCEIFTFRHHAIWKGRRKDMRKGDIRKLSNRILKDGKDIRYVAKKFCKWLSSDGHMKDLINFLSGSDSKYPPNNGWSHCYYFLYEYEYKLSGNYGYSWDPKKYDSIEHILPETIDTPGDPNCIWWSANWDDPRTAEEFKHRLGNLVLTNNNSALSNKT